MKLGIFREAENAKRAALVGRKALRRAAVGAAEVGSDRVEGIGEVRPGGRRVAAGVNEAAARPLPAGERPLRLRNLVRAHSFEIIVPRVVLPDVVETQQLIIARPVEIRWLHRRLIFTQRPCSRERRTAPPHLPPCRAFFDCWTPLTSSKTEPLYIGAMDALATGPVALEMRRRLASLNPTKLDLIDDTEKHHGHGGLQSGGRKPLHARDRKPRIRGQVAGRAAADGSFRAWRTRRQPSACAVDQGEGARGMSNDDILLTLAPVTHDLGGFKVHRTLPHKQRTMVGPFIFFDQMGPAHLSAGQGIDVRPHPHINLSTVTFLLRRRDRASRQPGHPPADRARARSI